MISTKHEDDEIWAPKTSFLEKLSYIHLVLHYFEYKENFEYCLKIASFKNGKRLSEISRI